jgi:hypothetical protein
MTPEVNYLIAMSCAVPTVVGFLRWKKIPKQYKVFVYLQLLAVLSETGVYLFRYVWPGCNCWPLVINTYTFIFLGVSLWFFKKHGYVKDGVYKWLLLGMVLCTFWNYAYENFDVTKPFFYPLGYTATVLLIIGTRILSLQTMATHSKLVDNFWFWFSSFTVIKSAIALLIFGAYYFALFNTPEGKSIARIHHIVSMLCYLTLTIAVFKIPKRTLQT